MMPEILKNTVREHIPRSDDFPAMSTPSRIAHTARPPDLSPIREEGDTMTLHFCPKLKVKLSFNGLTVEGKESLKILGVTLDTVSYTHLTLPTTPYV